MQIGFNMDPIEDMLEEDSVYIQLLPIVHCKVTSTKSICCNHTVSSSVESPLVIQGTENKTLRNGPHQLINCWRYFFDFFTFWAFYWELSNVPSQQLLMSECTVNGVQLILIMTTTNFTLFFLNHSLVHVSVSV